MKLFVSTLLILLIMLPLSFAVGEKNACGAVSLYYLAQILGIDISLTEVTDTLNAKNKKRFAASFAELITCAKEIGLELQGLKLTYAQLQKFNTPVIVHLKTTFADENPEAVDNASVGHFIVVEHATEKWVRIFDAPRESIRGAATVVSRDRFLELWTGKTLALSQKQQRQKHPILYATPTLHDFENGKEGEYRIPVRLQNRSSSEVKILSVTVDCNCTVVKKQVNVIPAGGTISLDVNWDTRLLNRSFFSTTHIQTDLPHRPHIFVSLGLIREFPLTFVPEKLYLKSAGASDIKRNVELLNRSETAIRIQKIESSQAWIRARFPSNALIFPWRAANIELKFEAEHVPRNDEIDETFTVHYVDRDGDTKILTLPISGNVNQRYTLTPNRFFFGRINTTEENTRAVVLNNLNRTKLHIEKVETNVGTVQVEMLEDENHYQLRLALPSPLPTGILKGEVQVHTSDPKMRLIKVPVFAIVTR